MTRDIADQLAAIAHQLWREEMEWLGWQRGERFDAQHRQHDALVPWAELSEQDRRHARLGIECDEVDQMLISCIRYQRGADREFTAEEMRHGLPVAFVDPAESAERPAPRGTVIDWAVDSIGELQSIRVQWEDGDVSEHHPAVRELRRVE